MQCIEKIQIFFLNFLKVTTGVLIMHLEFYIEILNTKEKDIDMQITRFLLLIFIPIIWGMPFILWGATFLFYLSKLPPVAVIILLVLLGLMSRWINKRVYWPNLINTYGKMTFVSIVILTITFLMTLYVGVKTGYIPDLRVLLSIIIVWFICLVMWYIGLDITHASNGFSTSKHTVASLPKEVIAMVIFCLLLSYLTVYKDQVKNTTFSNSNIVKDYKEEVTGEYISFDNHSCPWDLYSGYCGYSELDCLNICSEDISSGVYPGYIRIADGSKISLVNYTAEEIKDLFKDNGGKIIGEVLKTDSLLVH